MENTEFLIVSALEVNDDEQVYVRFPSDHKTSKAKQRNGIYIGVCNSGNVDNLRYFHDDYSQYKHSCGSCETRLQQH